MTDGRKGDGGDAAAFWNLIKDHRVALLVTLDEAGRPDARPMGCIQREFDGHLWFMTLRGTHKVGEVESHEDALISYARPDDYEYVVARGRARRVDDEAKKRSLWSEALRVWFPKGVDDPDMILLDVEVEEARYWTNAASRLTYAAAYVRARVTGKRPEPGEIADTGVLRPGAAGRSGG